MLKNNKKGFALIEALVVTVFVSIVFAFLYINLIPIMSQYEAEEKFDNIDTKYVGNLIINQIKSYSSNDVDKANDLHTAVIEAVDTNNYLDISDAQKTVATRSGNVYIYGKEKSDRERFEKLKKYANIERVYIVPFDITNTKGLTTLHDSNTKIDKQTLAYIKYLPSFSEVRSNANYRLIIALRDAYGNNALYYGTIEFDY